MLPSAVARTPAPSPGHTGHDGTRETGSWNSGTATSKAMGSKIMYVGTVFRVETC
jgi:hypothetical protein